MPEYTLAEYEEETYRLGEPVDDEDPDRIPRTIAETLWKEANKQVAVELPSVQTGGKIILKNRGYAGRVQLPNNYSIILEPKIKIKRLLRLLRYAEGLESFEFLDRLYDSASIDHFYDSVVEELTKGVVKRQRKGLYQEYIEKREKSDIVRGKIDFAEMSKHPWESSVPIKYSDLTPDIEDNQILLWTLFVARSSGLVSNELVGDIKKAYQSLSRLVSLKQYKASDCLNRSYQRLNREYERLHVLCYIILSQSSPVRTSGAQQMIPWAIDMAVLFEKVVANWVSDEVNEPYSIKSQEDVEIGDSKRNYEIDLVLCRERNPVAVADTKYKTPSQPSTEDISQLIGYAEAAGVENAYLIYPEYLKNPINTRVGDISIDTLRFSLKEDIKQNKEDFISDLLPTLNQETSKNDSDDQNHSVKELRKLSDF
jgi:5-methylcytosine-specific restriction enzyme subunit McrC